MAKQIKKYYFEVQGGGSQPYTIQLTLEPLTISCTCAAAYTNTPCKHRMAILNGENPGFLEAPKNYNEILNAAKQAAEGIGLFPALEAYQNIKNEKQTLEKITLQEFKNWKEALIFQKGQKIIEKANNKMNDAMLAEMPVRLQYEAILSELNKVFVRHNTDIAELAKTALASPQA
jgi:hypothetical protein